MTFERFLQLVEQFGPRRPPADDPTRRRTSRGVQTGIAATRALRGTPLFPSTLPARLAERTVGGRLVPGALRALGGVFVMGGAAILQDTYRALRDSDQLIEYTAGALGYADTLARMAAAASDPPRGSPPHLPQPIVPPDMASGRFMGMGQHISAYRQGYWRVNGLLREVDNIRPPGAYVSELMLLELRSRWGNPGNHSQDRPRIREQLLQQVFRLNPRTLQPLAAEPHP